MSDFWQAPNSGLIINLEHIVSIDRTDAHPDASLRVITVVQGVTFTIKAGSPEEESLLNAIGRRLGTAGQIAAELSDIREAIDRIGERP